MSSLKELQDRFAHMESVWSRGEEAALLMISSVRGSSYRRPGAKITISSDGDISGTLSGGCLESDLMEWAKQAIIEKKSIKKSYDLGENELWGLGIGCKGSLDVLIIPISREDAFWKKVREEVASERQITLALNISTGTGWLFNKNEQVLAQHGESPSELILNSAAEIREQRNSATLVGEGDTQVVIDVVRPREKLVVAGAGHDAVPVVELALKADFDVTVLDPRVSFNTEERFPSARHLVVEASAADSDTIKEAWWVIMNHHLQRDNDALQLALQSEPKYIGLLGPFKRTEELFEGLGINLKDHPVYTPIGLDLGAETIEEVAISIVSQLLAIRNGKEVVHLHGKSKIH